MKFIEITSITLLPEALYTQENMPFPAPDPPPPFASSVSTEVPAAGLSRMAKITSISAGRLDCESVVPMQEWVCVSVAVFSNPLPAVLALASHNLNVELSQNVVKL